MSSPSLSLFGILAILFLSACQNEDEQSFNLQDHIIAGEQASDQVRYTDIDGAWDLTVVYAYDYENKYTDLDLDGDGTVDFTFHSYVLSPVLLGGDEEQLYLIPRGQNEMALSEISEYFVDTIAHGITINEELNWIHQTTRLYSHYYTIGNSHHHLGPWYDVLNYDEKYVAVRVNRSGVWFYGWINLRCLHGGVSRFYLNDYAITRIYEE